jgi:hypothetical protein
MQAWKRLVRILVWKHLRRMQAWNSLRVFFAGGVRARTV